MTAIRLLQLCPEDIRDKHIDNVDKLGGALAWCAMAARELALSDPYFGCRDHATFVVVINRSKLSDPLTSISLMFLPDERDIYLDPRIGELNAALCRRPNGARGERLLRFRMEVEDRLNADSNPNTYLMVSLDEAEFWRWMPFDQVAAIKAAIRECGPSKVAEYEPAAGSRLVALWDGVADRVLLETLRSAQGSCICCLTRTTMRCTCCGRAAYCSRECQVSDFRTNHKAICEAGAPETASRAFDVLCAAVRSVLAQEWDVVFEDAM